MLPIEVSIVLPTYNEKENLEVLIPKISGLFANKGTSFEILVVDDNSPDGTKEYIRSLSEEFPQLRLILRENKEGIGAALKNGYDESRGALIISSDADQSFEVSDMFRLIETIDQGFDLVVGSRHMAKDSYEKKAFSTKIKGLISWSGNILVRFLSGVKIRDFSANFRAIRSSVWNSIETKESTNSILLEMIMKSHYNGYKVAEIPVKFSERVYGDSKLNLVVEAPKFLIKLISFTIRFRILRRK